ncbi:zinc-ribbon domain-containing protein [Metabacillus sp. RGM 3146]
MGEGLREELSDSTQFCSSCGHQTEKTAKFCSECGESM